MRTALLLACVLLSCAVSFSQTDTLSLRIDSFPKTYHPEVVKPAFNWRTVIIPGTMIAYGVTALKCDWFQDWNESIKHEIWTETPHQLVHIDNYLQWAPAASTFALGFAGVKGKHNFPDRAFMFGMAELIQSSVVATVKKLSKEMRPNGESNQSFPSGHTTNAFTGAEFMRLEYKDVSPWYGVYGYALAATTGFLRMYNNKHWLSDVLAGAGTGILATDFTYFLYPKLKRLILPKKELHTVIIPTYQQGSIGFALVKRF
jgi:hypothetical protein